MTALAEFLAARLDEDEQAATQGGINGARWDFTGASCEVRVREPGGNLAGVVARCREGRAIDFSNTIHIALHDPARVLREVAAKRKILAVHQHRPVTDPDLGEPGTIGCVTCSWSSEYSSVMGEGLCDTVRALAAVWSDHPDYDQDWAP